MNLRSPIRALENIHPPPPELPHLFLYWDDPDLPPTDLLHGGLSFEDGGPGMPINPITEESNHVENPHRTAGA